MSLLTHIRLMANYSVRMNKQIYEAAGKLEPEQVAQNTGAFFGSLLGTLNHLVVADLIWGMRFLSAFPQFTALQKLVPYPKPQALEQVLYPDFGELRRVRGELDDIFQAWMLQLNDEVLEQDLEYRSMRGIASARNLGEVILHVYNHHTHHRGQATTLLSQFGQDYGITDFLIDVPDRLAQK